MLPAYLLPSGALAGMRRQAQDFMRQPMTIYAIELGYDRFGTQIVTSGAVVTTSGYIGGIRGSDRELMSATMQSYTQRQGVRVKTDALVLLPFETQLDTDYIINTNDQDWHIVYHNNETMNGVQVYTKAICVQYHTEDEKEHG